MTKRLKRVLTAALVGVMAISACLFGTLGVSADTAASQEAQKEFASIITTFMANDPIKDEDLANADVQVKLIQAKAYYDKMERAERESLDSDIAEEWAAILDVAGDALSAYSAMTSLSIYLRENNAPRISVHKKADIDKASLLYQALGEDSNSKKFVDMRIAYDDPNATPAKSFFPDLYTLIGEAQAAIDKAIAAIDAIWAGVEVIGLDREDEINNATAKIEAVLPSDRIEITNMALYNKAVDELAAIKAEAKALADEIDALYATVTSNAGQEVYYSKVNDINALKASFDALEETEANAVQTYFKAAHVDQYNKLVEMLGYCDTVATEIENVINLINAIGTVTYTTECETAIVAAETAYEALDADVKNVDHITNYPTLVEARTAYDNMKTAIDSVIALIDAIPDPVVLTNDCLNAIVAAETAYDALSQDYKANVPADKYGELVAAREAYDALEAVVKAWIDRVKAFYTGSTIADIWDADLSEIAALENEYTNVFNDNARAYVDAKGATTELADIKAIALANVDETQADIDALATTAPNAIVEALLAAKEKFDTLHSTQQELINKTVLNEKWAKYQAVSYFDKAVANIKANVDAEIYIEQDVTMMNTLFVLYNVLDEEGRAMVKSYADLLAIEVVFSDAEIVDLYETNKELAEKLDAEIAELEGLIEDLESEINDLKGELDAAKSSAKTATIIAIIALVAAIAGIVLVFVKKN